MIHVAMEDVWVWDKNRPTRIIPRADIHTTQDVTIEELRPPEEHAAARAGRRVSECCSRSTSGTRRRTWASGAARSFAHTWRIATRPLRTADDLAVQLDGLLALRDLDTAEVDRARGLPRRCRCWR